MYRVSRTHKLDDDSELSEWLDKKYREKILVGDMDIKDQRSDDDERRKSTDDI